ncbi:MAG: hypothetical protein AAF844_03065 [Pseudomonadota bacterium]
MNMTPDSEQFVRRDEDVTQKGRPNWIAENHRKAAEHNAKRWKRPEILTYGKVDKEIAASLREDLKSLPGRFMLGGTFLVFWGFVGVLATGLYMAV